MGRAKEIELKVIPKKIADEFVKSRHYSGKIVNNSQLHFGAFLDNRLHGVMQFGPSMSKAKIVGLVKDTGWNDFIELNRMAFDDYLPRNSESRCISQAIKLIKKNAPHIRWIISFADAAQCGDGAIYRASNFVLTGYTKTENAFWRVPPELVELNSGEIAHKVKIQCKSSLLSKYILSRTNGKNLTIKGYIDKFGGEAVSGYSFRYIYFIDKSYIDKLTVPVLPFSIIDELGGRMYKGQKINGEF